VGRPSCSSVAAGEAGGDGSDRRAADVVPVGGVEPEAGAVEDMQ
jgi:hypothetical protein